MDWLTFVSEIVKTLAWPVSVLMIIILLKKPLTELIPSITKLKYKEFELDFDMELEEAEKIAEEARLPKTTDMINNQVMRVNSNAVERLSYIKDVNLRSSRDGIIDSWLLVEEALRKLAEKNEFRSINMPPMKILRDLSDNKVITHELFEICDRLYRIRNEAVHNRTFKVSPNKSNEYINLTFRVLASLNHLLDEREAG
ncbi:hypothetical protein ACFSL6_19840 [Paenibacillus thailandensis]|uniref:DUF4145 domain-containing protein n=1 Tax=Paenibacillus thailandensis TaxID=393250 RepID=A0ABW5QU97_9BACL